MSELHALRWCEEKGATITFAGGRVRVDVGVAQAEESSFLRAVIALRAQLEGP